MAREDFCFTYYDGDAARDKAHMTRLDRGAYDDIISAQRKFGRLTLDQIKRVLGRDFEECWPSIELIIKVEIATAGAGKYYIEWVEKSLEKSKKNSQINKEKVEERWRKEREKEQRLYNGITPEVQQKNNSTLPALPLENGNGIELKNEMVSENSPPKSEDRYLVVQMSEVYRKFNPNYPGDKELDFKPLFSIAKFLCSNGKLNGPPEENSVEILNVWEKISIAVSEDNFYSQKSLSTISNHIQQFTQKVIHGTTHRQDSSGKPVARIIPEGSRGNL